MDDEIERLVISVRADTATFARDVAAMRGELEGPLVAGAGRAGRMIDSALVGTVTCKLFSNSPRFAYVCFRSIADKGSASHTPTE